MKGASISGSCSLSVALAISSFFPNVGGAEITLHNLAQRLQHLGHRPVVLVSFTYWRRLRKSLHRFGYPIIPLLPKQHAWTRKWGERYLGIQDQYFGILQRKYRFDVWQSFGAFPVGVGVAHFAAPRGLPHVVRTVGYDVQKLSGTDYGYRRHSSIDSAVRKWMPRCSCMIALSDSVVEDCASLGVKRAHISTIPCAVDADRFQATVVDRKLVRQRYGLPEDAFLYITVGRNHPKKGFVHLLAATKILNERGAGNFRVLFVGRDMEPLHQLARQMGIEGIVTFANELGLDFSEGVYQVPGKDLIELYRSSDACVFPSLLETFALINIEAMAAGLPVISTDAPGCRETIRNGVDGLVAPAGDPAGLADLMGQVQGSESLRTRLVSAGSQTVRAQYTWDVVASQFEDLYLELSSQRGRQLSMSRRSA